MYVCTPEGGEGYYSLHDPVLCLPLQLTRGQWLRPLGTDSSFSSSFQYFFFFKAFLLIINEDNTSKINAREPMRKYIFSTEVLTFEESPPKIEVIAL